MIINVFSKSRPFNYVLVTTLLVIAYVFFQFQSNYSTISLKEIVEKVGLLLVLVGSLFITNFITKKNGLSKDNSYTFMLFAVFLILFPNTLSDTKLIISNAFILLALRRLISMQSMLTPKEKIFDASIWIFAASLLNFWCILFILLVFASIAFHVSRDYTNWIIPFIALATVVVIAVMVALLINPDFINNYAQTIVADFDLKYIQNIFQNIAIGIYILAAFVAFVAMIIILPNKMSNFHSAYRKILFAFVIGLAVYFISPNKHNSYLIYTFVPVAIMLTNYLETIKKFWIKESIVGILVIASIVTYLLQIFG